MEAYGKELVLDLHDCDSDNFTRVNIEAFFVELCEKMGVERGDLNFWDYEDEPEKYEKAPDHLKGISAIQFIMTSNVTIHTLDVLRKCFLNIFSCDDFEVEMVVGVVLDWFGGRIVTKYVLERK